MNGVDILAINEIASETAFNWTVFWIFFCVVVAFFVLIGFSFSLISKSKSDIVIGIALGIMFGLFLGGVLGNGMATTVAYEKQYKVIISDEVSMNDFLEKYEIIDQEGKLYTVMERTQK